MVVTSSTTTRNLRFFPMKRDFTRRLRLFLVLPVLLAAANATASVPPLGYGWS